ncbi:hypothetical protein [Sphingopyxis sp. SCN 67-31]|uniref:hypothetical protein n=1 Tax=Sphingopyxis sp. SCN 67-31 TaxID=1660142 RepID=UPI00257D339A|nr:hypothetical protein [Sphingopyxis sp. SCN 67-31]
MGESLGYDLRIKYGLTDDPSAEMIEAWAQRVTELAAEISDTEEAGRKASIEIVRRQRQWHRFEVVI